MEPSAARLRRARRIHSACGTERLDRRNRRLGAARGKRAGAPLARFRRTGLAGRGERVGRAISRRQPGVARVARHRCGRDRFAHDRAGIHRRRVDRIFDRGEQGGEVAEGAWRGHGARRLRHRLQLLVVSAALSDRHAQDRQSIRARHRLQSGGNAPLVDAIIAMAKSLGSGDGGRGRGDRGAVAIPQDAGCKSGPGLPVLPPAADRRLAALACRLAACASVERSRAVA